MATPKSLSQACLLALAFAGCATATRPPVVQRLVVSEEPPPPVEPDEVEDEPTLDVSARLEGDVLAVEATLPLDWVSPPVGAVRLQLTAAPSFSDGSAGYESFITAVDEHGQERPFDGVFPVDAGASRLVARYRVALRHHLAGPSRGIDEVPRPTRGGWALVGRAFLPRYVSLADGRRLEVPVRLALEVPEGAELFGSPPRNATGAFVAERFSALADAVYVVGRFALRELRVDGALVRLVTSDFDEETLDRVANLVERALLLGRERLGPIPDAERTIVVDLNPRGIDGGLLGSAIVALSAEPPSSRATDDSGVVMVHELFHLWNRSDAFWLNEGFTRFFEVTFKAELDGLSSDELHAAMARVIEAYIAGAGERPIAESAGSWAYAGGALIAFCADAALRAHGSDVLAVHRAARARTTQRDSATIDPDLLLEEIARVSPAVAGELRAMLASRELVDWQACAARAGLAASHEPYQGFSGRVLGERVLGISAWSSYFSTITSAPEGALLRAGDRIVRAGDREVRSFHDLDHALSRARAGSRIVLHVRRGSGELTERVVLRMPRLAPADRERHHRVVLTARP